MGKPMGFRRQRIQGSRRREGSKDVCIAGISDADKSRDRHGLRITWRTCDRSSQVVFRLDSDASLSACNGASC